MSVTCKFRVTSITRALGTRYNTHAHSYEECEVHTIKFVVSYDPAFHASTPCGEISLDLIHEHHAKHFVLGKEYFADFSPVPEPVPALLPVEDDVADRATTA